MNLVMNERRLINRRDDLFRIHGLMTNSRYASPRFANGGMTRELFHREWLAQRTWEDDGGRVGQNPAWSHAM
jgi:hypothetical protein